jgi:hypothetical protein
MDRRQLLLRSIPIQQRIFALAERNLNSRHREAGNLAVALFDHTERFSFLEYEGVEPTNNSAERTLRTGVQWRKICFGNRSANGELATARLLNRLGNLRPPEPQHPGLSLQHTCARTQPPTAGYILALRSLTCVNLVESFAPVRLQV